MALDQRQGDWMQTATGGEFWPMDPRVSEVKIQDIAHSLSNMCRYAGHCLHFYSVAQHSVLVSQNVPRENALWGLLHDASEAYLVDVPRPVKPSLGGYREIESGVMAVVCKAFDLPPEMPDEVKRVDEAILADEAAQLMAAPPRDWCLREPALGIGIVPWSPEVARVQFMQRFLELTLSE